MIDKDPQEPFWVLISFAMVCGLAGEIYRADKAGLPWSLIFRRAALRFGFCSLSAVIVGLLCQSAGADMNLTLALSGIAGLLGADIMLAFFERFFFAKFGVQH